MASVVYANLCKTPRQCFMVQYTIALGIIAWLALIHSSEEIESISDNAILRYKRFFRPHPSTKTKRIWASFDSIMN